MPFSIRVHYGPAKDDPSRAPKLVFDGTQRVVIGRGPGCDVRIPDATVSHRHASLRSNGSSIVVLDEGSTNGTFVAGTKLDPRTPCPVSIGTTFTVGAIEVTIGEAEGPATREVALATRELAMKMVQEALARAGEESTPIVRVVEGPDTGRSFRLDEFDQPYKLGRDPNAPINLTDPDISRASVELVRTSRHIVVRNVGAKNRVFVGDLQIAPGQEVAWRAALPLRIGQTWMTLQEPIAEALQALEEAPDSPVPAKPPKGPVPEQAEAREPHTATPTAAGTETRASVPPAKKTHVPTVKRKSPVGGGLENALAVFALLVLLLSLVGIVWLIRSAR